MEKCKKGDRKSQYKLYEIYVDAMFNISMRMLRSKEDAEDVVQESFVAAFKSLNGFKYESSFGAWLKRIVINKSINQLKCKRAEVIPVDERDYVAEEEDNESAAAVELEKVRIGIDKLPDGYRQVLNLYLIEGYDHSEIGEILTISTSTSKSQYHRAKKRLLEIINT